ncbi:MAG: aspartate aminotransferase family protein [Syntrophomonas sp.]|nr:aspartate aminotransferase family protein [Syntrophomonas sp.]
MINNEIISKGQEYIMNTYNRFPIAMVKGKGSYVWDADGKEYLDFLGGIAVCVLGHCNDALQARLKEQAADLWHISNLYWIKPQVELAEKLVKVSGLGKAFFCNSGAEANEAAIKLTRKYFYRRQEANKNEIIVFNDSFHGRTLATVTATGQRKYQEGFDPLPQGFVYANYNDIASVKKLITKNTAAVMLEAVQGEGGIHPADHKFIQELRSICDRENLLLIFDEVQCGIGRTGTFFACQAYGIRPDIVTMAKGLGGGFPIGAMLATDEAATGFAPGDHASTFGGNPLAMAVANTLVDTVTAPQFMESIKELGIYLQESLKQIVDSRIIDVRGKGLMLGVEMNTEVKELVQICLQKGLLLGAAGPKVVRFVPPLNINKPEIDQAAAIFKDALQEWQ